MNIECSTCKETKSFEYVMEYLQCLNCKRMYCSQYCKITDKDNDCEKCKNNVVDASNLVYQYSNLLCDNSFRYTGSKSYQQYLMRKSL